MSISATIDRFEDKLAVLRLDDGQELVLPVVNLPSGVREGSRLILEVMTAEEDEAKRVERARQLLNDLLTNKQS